MKNMKIFSFFKYFSLVMFVISFFLLTFAGTPIMVKGDLIMDSIMGTKNLINAIGASGTVLASLGFISLSLIFILEMYKIIKETREEKGPFMTALIATVILTASSLLLAYSSVVMFYGLGLIRDAYNSDIYGCDTIVLSVHQAFSLKMPLIIVGFALLIFLYKVKTEKNK